MTRYVRRRRPRPVPPWEWKGTWATGPPKTLLSNRHEPVVRRITGQTSAVVGDYDFLLRLYRRRSPSSVLPEWDQIPPQCLWLEQVDEENEVVLRLDMKSAKMWGTRTPRGWQIPLDHYSMHEQEYQ